MIGRSEHDQLPPCRWGSDPLFSSCRMRIFRNTPHLVTIVGKINSNTILTRSTDKFTHECQGESLCIGSFESISHDGELESGRLWDVHYVDKLICDVLQHDAPSCVGDDCLLVRIHATPLRFCQDSYSHNISITNHPQGILGSAALGLRLGQTLQYVRSLRSRAVSDGSLRSPRRQPGDIGVELATEAS